MADDRIFTIPVKGGGRLRVTNEQVIGFDDAIYEAIVVEGLKSLCNRGMTKVSVKGLEGEDLDKAKAAALVIAEKNLQNLVEGKRPRMVGQRASDGKVPGAVMTEARRDARDVIKDTIKANGGKISHYEARDITAAANAYLTTEEGKVLIEKAKATIAARAKAIEDSKADSEEAGNKLELLGLKPSASKVAKAEQAKAKAKEAGAALLSATQAGRVKARTVPQPSARN